MPKSHQQAIRRYSVTGAPTSALARKGSHEHSEGSVKNYARPLHSIWCRRGGRLECLADHASHSINLRFIAKSTFTSPDSRIFQESPSGRFRNSWFVWIAASRSYNLTGQNCANCRKASTHRKMRRKSKLGWATRSGGQATHSLLLRGS